MKRFFLVGILLSPTALLAQPDKATPEVGQLIKINASLGRLAGQLEQTQAQQKKLMREQKNPRAFCYLGDKAYSEGAVVNGAECTRSAADKLNASDTRPLVWATRPGAAPKAGGKTG